jgi:hypothetical protein
VLSKLRLRAASCAFDSLLFYHRFVASLLAQESFVILFFVSNRLLGRVGFDLILIAAVRAFECQLTGCEF